MYLLFPECLPQGLLFPAGLAPVMAQEMSTVEMLSNTKDLTTPSPAVKYNMTNSTQSVRSTTVNDAPYTTPSGIPLSTTSPNMTRNSTTSTMVETGKKYFWSTV